jgi:hypothetical protein
MSTEMKRTTTAQQMAFVAVAARPCALGHAYDASETVSWSKQGMNEFITVPARRLRKRTT